MWRVVFSLVCFGCGVETQTPVVHCEEDEIVSRVDSFGNETCISVEQHDSDTECCQCLGGRTDVFGDVCIVDPVVGDDDGHPEVSQCIFRLDALSPIVISINEGDQCLGACDRQCSGVSGDLFDRRGK